jgi:hypothetical protein
MPAIPLYLNFGSIDRVGTCKTKTVLTPISGKCVALMIAAI